MSALDANFELISRMQRPNVNGSRRLAAQSAPRHSEPRHSEPRQATAVRNSTISNAGRRRVSLALAVMFVLLATSFAIISNQPATATDSQVSVSVQHATVASGESLWAVAERVAPNVDPRDWIDQVIDLNALHGSDVVAGQRLVVPQN